MVSKLLETFGEYDLKSFSNIKSGASVFFGRAFITDLCDLKFYVT